MAPKVNSILKRNDIKISAYIFTSIFIFLSLYQHFHLLFFFLSLKQIFLIFKEKFHFIIQTYFINHKVFKSIQINYQSNRKINE